jgi:hypothetical protein
MSAEPGAIRILAVDAPEPASSSCAWSLANQPGSDLRSRDCRRNTAARRFMDAHRGSTSGNH